MDAKNRLDLLPGAPGCHRHHQDCYISERCGDPKAKKPSFATSIPSWGGRSKAMAPFREVWENDFLDVDPIFIEGVYIP